MTGDTDADSASDDLFGQVGLSPLRRAGYNVLTWDARGFGQSGGPGGGGLVQFEGRDVQALIDFAAKQPEAQLDRPGDPRMGMNGVSYGGGIQLVTAAIDKRVDVITPTIAWNDLLTALYKEQVVKTGWGSILLAAGGTSIAGGLANISGPETGSQDPQITQAGVEGVSTGKFSDRSVAFFRSRGLPGLVNRVRVPTLLIEGTADTLFTLDEARRNHAILRGNGVPVRMVWFCGGHGACLTPKGPADLVEKSVLTWFARYLKRDTSVKTGAPFSYVAQDGKAARRSDLPAGRGGRAAGLWLRIAEPGRRPRQWRADRRLPGPGCLQPGPAAVAEQLRRRRRPATVADLLRHRRARADARVRPDRRHRRQPGAGQRGPPDPRDPGRAAPQRLAAARGGCLPRSGGAPGCGCR